MLSVLGVDVADVGVAESWPERGLCEVTAEPRSGTTTMYTNIAPPSLFSNMSVRLFFFILSDTINVHYNSFIRKHSLKTTMIYKLQTGATHCRCTQ